MLKHLLIAAVASLGCLTAVGEEVKCLVIKTADAEFAFFGEEKPTIDANQTDVAGVYNLTFKSTTTEVTVAANGDWTAAVEMRTPASIGEIVNDADAVEFNGVEVKSAVDATLKVIGLNGACLMTRRLKASEPQSLDALAAGVYILQVNNHTIKITKK